MARKQARRDFTPLELEMMNALWAKAPATVAEVQHRLAREPRLAYTTVQTMLNVLERKGKVKRTLRGRAYHYAPVISREKAIKSAVRDLTERLFGGSAEGLVMSMVENRQITPERLAKLSKLVAERQEDDHGRHDEPGRTGLPD